MASLTFVIEEFIPPHWRGRLTTRDRDRALALAELIVSAGSKMRILEFPGGREIAFERAPTRRKPLRNVPD